MIVALESKMARNLILLFVSLIGILCVTAHECPIGESECHNFQCCKPNQYCGVNSHECEPCFPLEATEEDNFQTCLGIRNVSDVALRLRHSSCVAACLYTFGGKLYESCSNNDKPVAESGEKNQQTESFDKNTLDIKPGSESGEKNQQTESSVKNTLESSCSFPRVGYILIIFACGSISTVAILYGPGYIIKAIRSHRRSSAKVKDETPHLETGTRAGDQQTESLDKKKGNVLSSVKRKRVPQGYENVKGHKANGNTEDYNAVTYNLESTSLIADSHQETPPEESDLQLRHVGTLPLETPSGANHHGTSNRPETPRSEPARSEPAEARPSIPTQPQGTQPHAMQTEGNRQETTAEARQFETPQPGVWQTVGATQSKGYTLNPITTPVDETNAHLYI